jgi:hypothetical protein
MTTPTPIPGKRVPGVDPSLYWAGKPLANYASKPLPDAPVQWKSETGPIGGYNEYADDERSEEAFEPLEGVKTLKAAVKAAAELSDEESWTIRTRTKVSPAVGVLQAADGSFWLTELASLADTGNYREPQFIPNIDLNLGMEYAIERVEPQLQAIVGAHSWVDFSTAAAPGQPAKVQSHGYNGGNSDGATPR